MLLVSSVHVHPASAYATVACDECAHHLPHAGHLSTGGDLSHDCLLCQLLTFSYVAGAVAAVVCYCQTLNIRFTAPQVSIQLSVQGQVGLRAPPSLSL